MKLYMKKITLYLFRIVHSVLFVGLILLYFFLFVNMFFEFFYYFVNMIYNKNMSFIYI